MNFIECIFDIHWIDIEHIFNLHLTCVSRYFFSLTLIYEYTLNWYRTYILFTHHMCIDFNQFIFAQIFILNIFIVCIEFTILFFFKLIHFRSNFHLQHIRCLHRIYDFDFFRYFDFENFWFCCKSNARYVDVFETQYFFVNFLKKWMRDVEFDHAKIQCTWNMHLL